MPDFCHHGLMAALIWLVAGVAFVAAEVLSGDFVLLMLGLGALGAAGADAMFGSLAADVAVFALLTVGLIVLARPALKRRLASTDYVPTNVHALVGGKATVVSEVDARTGQVKIGGEVWSARALAEGAVFEPGRSVTVVEISGATAIVWDEP